MIIPLLKDIRFLNVGEDPVKPKPEWVGRRQWEACINYNFVSAGQELIYNQPLLNLEVDDIIAAFITGRGYVGIGIVKERAVEIKDFSFNGKKLMELNIDNSFIKGLSINKETVETLPYLRKTLFCNADNTKTEYTVRIEWKKTVDKEDAFWRKNSGLFAKPHIQCSLKAQQKTIDYLKESFGVDF